MKRQLLIIIIIFIVIIFIFGILSNKKNSFLMNQPRSEKIIYKGSDPKGDYIEIEVNRTLNQITHINHTTGGTINGPFTYSNIPQGPDTGGFSNMHMASVGIGEVEYIMFMEYNDTMIVYQQYDASDNLIGNPEYAVISNPLYNSDLYETAYNYMFFNAQTPIEHNSDVHCGFIAFDDSTTNGLLYGAGYSKKAESDPLLTNGIKRLTDKFMVNDLLTNTCSGSRYININGGIGVEDKLVMIGTPSESLVFDFGPGLGGGSGLLLKQATSPDWNSSYDGTYYIMIYRYATASSESQINQYKLVLTTDAATGEGHLDVFDYMDNTSTGVPLFSSNLTVLSDLDAAHSPGGLVPITDQFEDISENNLAVSAIVQNANNCFGSFKGSDAFTDIFIIFEQDGRFGGLSSVYSDGIIDDIYEFGIMVKDPGYSDTGLVSPHVFPTGDPECILPVPDYEQGQVSGVEEYNNVAYGVRHEGIDFMFNDWPPSSSSPSYALHNIVAPFDGQIQEIVYESGGTFPPGYIVKFEIKYNNNFKSIVVLETYSDDADVQAIQDSEVHVNVGDYITQGDLLARFVVSNTVIPGTSDPTIHWGIYDDEVSGTKTDVCPYDYATPDAQLELEDIFLRIMGPTYEICLP